MAPEAHAQVVEGVVIETMCANEPRATEHTEVTHVLRGCLAPGYRAPVNMLTRTDRRNAALDVRVVDILAAWTRRRYARASAIAAAARARSSFA